MEEEEEWKMEQQRKRKRTKIRIISTNSSSDNWKVYLSTTSINNLIFLRYNQIFSWAIRFHGGVAFMQTSLNAENPKCDGYLLMRNHTSSISMLVVSLFCLCSSIQGIRSLSSISAENFSAATTLLPKLLETGSLKRKYSRKTPPCNSYSTPTNR
jgi:hypothetical protein